MNIVAGFSQINQVFNERFNASYKQFEEITTKINQHNIEIVTLTIDPLSTDWHSPEKENHFRSGCAPILAIKRAQDLIESGEHAVIISGEEPLKSGYSKAQRHKLMAIYNDETSISQLYNDLAHKFIDHHDSSKEDFLNYADHLFQNHSKSHQLAMTEGRAHFEPPEPKWFNQVTDLFRGVDCANPLVDFTGKLLLCSDQLISKLSVDKKYCVKVKGVGLGLLDIDEPKALSQIVKYDHLAYAYETACSQANLDFNQLVHDEKALMKVYTCYPVVPMAFLLNTGLVDTIEQIPNFLSKHLLTLSGGMNLARAPWNNPALFGLIEMYQQLKETGMNYGLVHGNGGIGYRQGVAILATQ